MANAFFITNAEAIVGLDAIVDAFDAGTAAVIEIYNGTAPADADATESNTLLASLTMSATAFGNSADANPGAIATAASHHVGLERGRHRHGDALQGEDADRRDGALPGQRRHQWLRHEPEHDVNHVGQHRQHHELHHHPARGLEPDEKSVRVQHSPRGPSGGEQLMIYPAASTPYRCTRDGIGHLHGYRGYAATSATVGPRCGR